MRRGTGGAGAAVRLGRGRVRIVFRSGALAASAAERTRAAAHRRIPWPGCRGAAFSGAPRAAVAASCPLACAPPIAPERADASARAHRPGVRAAPAAGQVDRRRRLHGRGGCFARFCFGWSEQRDCGGWGSLPRWPWDRREPLAPVHAVRGRWIPRRQADLRQGPMHPDGHNAERTEALLSVRDSGESGRSAAPPPAVRIRQASRVAALAPECARRPVPVRRLASRVSGGPHRHRSAMAGRAAAPDRLEDGSRPRGRLGSRARSVARAIAPRVAISTRG